VEITRLFMFLRVCEANLPVFFTATAHASTTVATAEHGHGQAGVIF
jgi:hypothetical protein